MMNYDHYPHHPFGVEESRHEHHVGHFHSGGHGGAGVPVAGMGSDRWKGDSAADLHRRPSFLAGGGPHHGAGVPVPGMGTDRWKGDSGRRRSSVTIRTPQWLQYELTFLNLGH